MTTDPFIEAARAEAGRQYSPEARLPAMKPADRMDELPRRCAVDGFMAGAEWARDRLTTQKVTEEQLAAAFAEKGRHVAYSVVPGELRCFCGAPGHWGSTAAHEQHALWHALSAAGIQPTPEHRIRELHSPDADGNCGHCTRGRVYPVPAPCETVRALAGGGEDR